jgi:Domain of unknown function (DUF4279)
MTMTDGMATLVISSPSHPAAYVTASLGIQPDWSAEKGDPRPRNGVAEHEPIRRRTFDASMWVLEVFSDPATKMAMDDDDAKAFGTLQVLVDRLMGRGETLVQLRQHYTVQLSWYGISGGFVLPIQLLRDLAELGLDLSGNVYEHDDDARPFTH